MPPHPGARRARPGSEGAGGLRRPTQREILAAIAEVEDLQKTLARFPGLSRDDLVDIMLGRRAQLTLALDERPTEESAPATEPEAQPEPAPSPKRVKAAPPAEPEPAEPSPRASAAKPAVGVVRAWTDGASRGNPGPASVGVVLRDANGEILAEIAERIGFHTNNVAEYQAVRHALLAARELGATEVQLHADSELVVRQLNGVYKVKNVDLKPLFDQVKALEKSFPRGVRYKHVPREQNRDADHLANVALDRE